MLTLVYAGEPVSCKRPFGVARIRLDDNRLCRSRPAVPRPERQPVCVTASAPLHLLLGALAVTA